MPIAAPRDPLYHQARQHLLHSDNVSVAHLQRRLRIGYQRAIDLRAALEGDAVEYRAGTDSWHIRPDADRVTDLLITLRAGGIHLAELSVQKPTLDEVFLALTGTDGATAAHQGRPAPHGRVAVRLANARGGLGCLAGLAGLRLRRLRLRGLRGLRGGTLESALVLLPAPTLAGEVEAREVARALRGEHRMIAGAGHYPMAEQPDEVLAAVEPKLWDLSVVLPIIQDTTIVAAGPSVQGVSLTGAVPVGIVGDMGGGSLEIASSAAGTSVRAAIPVHRPPLQHRLFHLGGGGGIEVELGQHGVQGHVDRNVDHQSHGAFAAVFAQIDQGALEISVREARHGEQKVILQCLHGAYVSLSVQRYLG